MSNYHTDSLKNADIFTIMGSIYAEISRYDSAVKRGDKVQADQAADRAHEIIGFTQNIDQITSAQKMEISKMSAIFSEQAKAHSLSNLDSYLMPFAVSARMRQTK